MAFTSPAEIEFVSLRLPNLVFAVGQTNKNVDALLCLPRAPVARHVLDALVLASQAMAKPFEILPSEFAKRQNLRTR